MGVHDEVSKAAKMLLAAVNAATEAGYVVQWPARSAGLDTIAVSATGAVALADTGEPLALTDTDRAALPPLDADALDDPAQHVAVKGLRRTNK